MRRARRENISGEKIADLVFWIMIAGDGWRPYRLCDHLLETNLPISHSRKYS